MKFINAFKEGERVNAVFFCKEKSAATTKNGKDYLKLLLQDRTGSLDSKIWNVNNPGVVDDYEAHDFVQVVGDVIVYNGALQMNVNSIRKAAVGTYNEADYIPASRFDIATMYDRIVSYVNGLQNPYLKALTSKFFIEDEALVTEFKKHSAAKTVHHGFVGGLLEHTLSVTATCEYLAKHYDYLNKDLLITAAMLHDIGKIKELSEFPQNDYTDDGQLLGHLVMGSEMIGRAAEDIPDFPPVLLRELKHCILAHHGELEYGSPKKPALMEALALHYADDLDAKLETFREALESPAGVNGDWLGFNRMLDSNIRRTSE